jgi:hypothetical protein
LAVAQHWKTVLIVTSNYHTRRARYIFSRIFPSTIAISVAAARDGDFDPEKWWESRKSVKLFSREVVGMVVTMWELRGKNAARQDGASVKSTVRSNWARVDQNGTILGQNSCLSLYIT